MSNVNEHAPETCKPVGEILSLVGDKWTAMLLGALGDRRMRFGELHRAIDGISQRMLTVTVRNLERDGLLIRTIYPTIPPRVDYELTELGISLREPVQGLGNWAMAHIDCIRAAQERYDAREDAADA